MKLNELEEYYQLELGQIYEEDETTALFSLAAEHVLQLTQIKLRMSRDNDLSHIHLQKMLSILNDLKMYKPIQHILGEAHFYGSVYKVNENVLIPRPETEELVDWIIADHSSRKDLNILDIGTGSGCIPISLKRFLPRAKVSSLDISEKALTVARENAQSLHTTVNFIQADILTYSSEDKLDIMVSNPPYIKDLEKEQMHQNVLSHEPHLALFVSNENPLVFYKAIADLAIKTLNPGGYLYLEINEYLGEETIDMLKGKGFSNIALRKDMQGKDRMIKAGY
ncbi:peptide chain release factor N(5)-glutamine methyltransferase [Pedobacter rhizosphaerae]|uniref:peptide chain release factor N(5)-glutamine methyltransferase n=1 Tax=Pedobacter rhizosphaerae TaxID=390241 RepID=A0A1H9RXT6_9SPHI|nr:peptide chain release factor N(5)-glutamine methyltransferase [Pedobacter rhizosphaerae]SER77571.1 release factor glutamine methyltransferase [Pedobacter rhizosphaerae]